MGFVSLCMCVFSLTVSSVEGSRFIKGFQGGSRELSNLMAPSPQGPPPDCIVSAQHRNPVHMRGPPFPLPNSRMRCARRDQPIHILFTSPDAPRLHVQSHSLTHRPGKRHVHAPMVLWGFVHFAAHSRASATLPVPSIPRPEHVLIGLLLCRFRHLPVPTMS